jgi:hypothetical protein
MSKLHRLKLNLEPLEDRRLLTEILTPLTFLSLTPTAASALVQASAVAQASVIVPAPAVAPVLAVVPAPTVAPALTVAPAQGTVGLRLSLTLDGAQLTRQVGHASLPASGERAASPATSSSVAAAASESVSLPALNAAESPSTVVAQSSPANAASTDGSRVPSNVVQAVRDGGPAARAEGGQGLPPFGSNEADIDSFFLEIWDQEQLLFPDAVPPTDELLFPGGLPAPDEMPLPPAIPNPEGPRWADTGLARAPVSSQPAKDATAVTAVSQTNDAQADPTPQIPLPGDEAGRSEVLSTRVEKTDGAALCGESLFPYVAALVGAVEVISKRPDVKETEET